MWGLPRRNITLGNIDYNDKLFLPEHLNTYAEIIAMPSGNSHETSSGVFSLAPAFL
ncbi:hypothetical protein H7J56_18765 [Mycolicibacterium murale]|jgi:hypothetical protein|uniref:hypothetical protein n=1 Tax=Mycolicibacterium murale TaxID=182220 RepID=UPI0021F325B7|nr:hypothetical protein [Mycolicibacterium murale]MCV7183993.1 hypothetical protein [Mycolicibacterium murale]